MAIYGITAGPHEVLLKEFLDNSKACTGRKNTGSRSSLFLFRQFRVEDIIFIKAFTPQSGLKVKAVGIVTSDSRSESDQGSCISVRWVWKGNKFIEDMDDNCPERSDSIYEEFNPWVQRELMDLMPASYSWHPSELSMPGFNKENHGASM